jgi:hypothetical protein
VGRGVERSATARNELGQVRRARRRETMSFGDRPNASSDALRAGSGFGLGGRWEGQMREVGAECARGAATTLGHNT